MTDNSLWRVNESGILGGHLKTGQSGTLQNRPVERVQDSHSFTLPATLLARVFLLSSHLPVYTDLTWAADRATQGCDPSADPAAGMAGRRQPPQGKSDSGGKAVNPRGLGTASPSKIAFFRFDFAPRKVEPPQIH